MNAMNNFQHTDDCRCISWQPIIIGALVATGLTFILNLFSVAIGLNSFTTGSDGVEKLLFGGLLATAIGMIAVMFASGWLAGYLSQRSCSKRHLGALYGFLVWCLALILLALLAGDLHHYVEYYTSFISGNPVFMHGNGMAPAAQSVMKTSHGIVVSTYILFVLFFLSAFACSLGGHVGARYICRD